MSLQPRYLGKRGSVKTLLQKELNAYSDAMIMQYHEDHLESENNDFANVLKEYRDGLLLFDLMEKEVWNAAVIDTLGQKNYYEAHKSNYIWQDRVDAIVVSGANEKDVEEAKALLQNGASIKDINAKLNSENEQKVIVTSSIMELSHQILPQDLEFKEGISKIYSKNDAYHVVKVNKAIPKTPKTFEESKGNVINDFQNEIEKNWLDTLNVRFKVKINKDVLSKVKSQINQ